MRFQAYREFTPPRIPSFLQGKKIHVIEQQRKTTKKGSVRTLSSSHSSHQEPHIEHTHTEKERGKLKGGPGSVRVDFFFFPSRLPLSARNHTSPGIDFGVPGALLPRGLRRAQKRRFGGRCSVRFLL